MVRQRGFTLVELLIALTLIALMVGLLSSALFFSSRAWDKAENQLERDTEIVLVWRFLSQQFQQARAIRAVVQENSNNKAYLFFQGERDRVEWLAPMPAYLGSGGLYILRLNMIRHQGKKKLLLTRWLYHPEVLEGQAKGIPKWVPLRNSRLSWQRKGEDVRAWYSQSVLLEDIKSFAIEYFGKDKIKGEATWRPRWQNDHFLPRLVKIKIEDQHGAWPTMVFQLPDN